MIYGKSEENQNIDRIFQSFCQKFYAFPIQ